MCFVFDKKKGDIKVFFALSDPTYFSTSYDVGFSLKFYLQLLILKDFKKRLSQSAVQRRPISNLKRCCKKLFEHSFCLKVLIKKETCK